MINQSFTCSTLGKLIRWGNLAREKEILAARADKAGENKRAWKCARPNFPRNRTCEPVRRLRGIWRL